MLLPAIDEGSGGMAVDDIEAAQKRVIDAGGKILLPPMDVPGGSRILQAVDDQGCNFALMQGPKS